jgi:hypothetical protein
MHSTIILIALVILLITWGVPIKRTHLKNPKNSHTKKTEHSIKKL